MTDLTDIEQLTRTYADARDLLAQRITTLNDELETTKRKKLRGLKLAVQSMAQAKDQLTQAIQAAPQLFTKPKTLITSGIKVGYAKSKGKTVIPDANKTVQLIRKHLPDQAEVLIKTEEKPITSALGNLTAAELKKIGVQVHDGTDQVVIKATDSEIDKLINALVAEAAELEVQP
ncbi:host-nuclease inhibitor Gam family protein [Oceanobacter mangrovi]|uniref:host-nuclease inhibitor Gam family protein n=1 Tax=Oceanobacter mangrovi TaxID=2862510 RepID=UPI001C8E2E3D|nr:host-nuclease inhibitor Gam family protein [Oceanobacter mangrovi]